MVKQILDHTVEEHTVQCGGKSRASRPRWVVCKISVSRAMYDLVINLKAWASSGL